jgi:hypothetical protein
MVKATAEKNISLTEKSFCGSMLEHPNGFPGIQVINFIPPSPRGAATLLPDLAF